MLQPPATATRSLATAPHQRGLLAAIFYASGGLATLLASFAPRADAGVLAALGLVALSVAIASYVFRYRFIYWATLGTSIAGPGLIAAGILAGHGGWASGVAATLYTFVAIHTALVLRWKHAAVIQVWAASSAVAAGWLVAPDLPRTVVAATYLLVCGTLWGVTTRLVEHVRDQAATDPLTDLPNRATFVDALDHALATVQRTDEPLSIVAIDLDEFKQINDTQGHAAGDAVLSAAADAWSAVLRARDTLACMGGDEFIAILPGSDPDEAADVAARLQDATPANASCSVGVATWSTDQTGEQLVRAADRALYRDKARRREAADSIVARS